MLGHYSPITGSLHRLLRDSTLIKSKYFEKVYTVSAYFDIFECMPTSKFISALADTDIRLLRVFQAVVRQQGFAAAQDEIGLSPATISNHIAHLETRLGVRLCNRGRKGFSMTPEGARVHDASLNLFRSVENFSSIIGSVRGELTGTVHFGTVDAMHTNLDLNLDKALRDFSRAAPDVIVHIDISSPHDLRQRLLDGRYQLILTPLEDTHSSIKSTLLFCEAQSLYCGHGHELFDVPEQHLHKAMQRRHRYAARTYVKEWRCPKGLSLRISAMSSHMESLALLILSGTHLGHLPAHYANGWVTSGHMRCLLPKVMSYSSTFKLAHLAGEQNRAMSLLRDLIIRHCRASGGR